MSLNRKSFIDTNIWLYAFIVTQNENKFNQAQELIQFEGESIILSTQIINEICRNLIKKAYFSESSISTLISSFYNHYTVYHLSLNTQLTASQLRERYAASINYQ